MRRIGEALEAIHAIAFTNLSNGNVLP